MKNQGLNQKNKSLSDQQAKNGDNERIHCNLKTRLRVLEIRLRIEKKDIEKEM